ncbi:efflux RND transporter periplasmic adaptor subunit [Thermosynechococcaceae cyanobacterium BACA0444]|uniref:Efflux RND transporter periplasmic adaptor subunit n=1 Tax=Pseudocalidococcus azoricus BACA0444 TaxID=2918990 RepID=A0AAE4FTT7_9CYAN|nr:efflux RND transporter periplasmic adaptor subunit [Pseudocalidococcus azoricus]MDS3861234.1 efflux RND transporter periplasmic adaptor subunit [Pseudocalidococcus azoricus BACA0444]
MLQRHWFASLVVGGTLLTGLGSCASEQAGAPPPPTVKVATVQAGMLVDTGTYNTQLQSRRAINLSPQVSGRIAQILVRSGVNVPQGAPLIQIDPSEQSAAVASQFAALQAAQATVETSRSELRALEAQRRSDLATLEFNRLQAERYTALFEQGAVSKEQAQSFILAYRTAQATLQSTDADIRAQQATIIENEKVLQQARANTQQQAVLLNWYTVNAPFAGNIGNIGPRVGDYVTPQTNLLTLTENQPLEIYINIPIERAADLRIGLPVELIDTSGKNIATSQVFFIDTTTNNNTQTILVKALYENRDNRLRANQQVQARVTWDQKPGVLVPTTAVSNLAGQNFVFVAEPSQDGKTVARQTAIQLGRIQGNNYQVLKGLQTNARIITSGIQRVRDGEPITPES